MPAIFALLAASAFAQAPMNPQLQKALQPKAYLIDASTAGLVTGVRLESFERADGRPLTQQDLARAQAILDRIFDGVSNAPKDKLGQALAVDARVRGDRLHSLTLTNPASGWSLETGQLGLGVNSPQVSPSWYLNLQGNADSNPDSWVDYRLKAQVGVVDLRSRVFPDRADPRPARVVELAKRLGLSPEKAEEIGRYVTYEDQTQTQRLVVTSLLAELGRAYSLGGPVDLTWAVGSLTRVLWWAPNQSFDQTLGLRVRLPESLNVGIFGGATQNLSPVGNRVFQEALDTGTLDAKLHLEHAPHAAVAFWGKAPGLSDVRFQATAGRRWNQDSRADKGELSVTTKFLDRPLAARVSVQDEKGTSFEYRRTTTRAALDYEVEDGINAFLAYERERIKYGNASHESDAVLLGLDVKLGKQSSLTYEQLIGSSGGRDPEGDKRFKALLEEVNRGLVKSADAIDAAVAAYNGIRIEIPPGQADRLLNELSLALSRLGPEQADALIRELTGKGLTEDQLAYLKDLWLKTVSPNSPLFNEIKDRIGSVYVNADDAVEYWKNHKGEIRELMSLLADEHVWNAALVNAARGQLLKALADNGSFEVPIGGTELRLHLKAPAVLAVANVMSSRLSPVAPIEKGDIQPRLLKEAGNALGIEGDHITEQMIADRVFQLAEERFRKELETRLDNAIRDAVTTTTGDYAASVLAQLPPEIANELRRRYGDNLQGLIDPNMTADAVKKVLLERVPPDLAAWLAQRYGADVAQGFATMTAWAAEVIRRELNMQMIRLMLASEELNRLTVDRGKKIDDLNLRFALRSFQMLDERQKPKVESRIKEIQRQLGDLAAREEKALVSRLAAQGKAQLAALQAEAGWPKGLAVAIPDASLAPLLAYYGDGAIFELLRRLSERYRACGKAELAVTLAYVEPRAGLALHGVAIRAANDGKAVEFQLPRPRDAGDAQFKLSGLETHLCSSP